MGELNADRNKETKRRAGERVGRRRSSRPLRLTERDREIVRWVHLAGVTTRAQVQGLFFGPGGRTRCQERLTLLVRHRYLEALSDGRSNSPRVYRVSRASVNGRRLLRAEGRDGAQERRAVSPWRLHHALAIAGCRAQVYQACSHDGIRLLNWLDEVELASMMRGSGLVPDAFFQVARLTFDGEKRSAFFLEVERSGKSDRALREKLRRYGEFYYGGRFEELFGSRALRVLVAFDSAYGIVPEGQIKRVRHLAEELGVTLLCMAPLDQFLRLDGSQVFRSPIWVRPEREEPVALLEI